ncbi:hypothetical protein POM88_018794 [Heracleum sosnowskyi]|uniref:TF-B3 domain-containing protein n=1 Tax=Heracleum sosnowskyi TaxID=360622 RepID=A0AAD8MZK2_9APIA|nr:hypothetical protein POM88_018794 [Heracleum sosnowskyi]
MESEDRQLSFICPNFSSHYQPGELILPLVFYVEHGKSLPSKVRLHVESSHAWSGTVVDGGKKIEGLEGMMRFYGIRSYSLVLLEYDGGVLSSYACHQLSLDESCKTLKLGFEKHFWNISVDFKNGSLYFGDGWIDFVDASCVMAGDSLSFGKTDENFKYIVCVFHGSLASKEVNIGVSIGLRSYARFFKMMTESSLKSEEIEVPRVFICNYGDELSNTLNVNLGGGISTQLNFFNYLGSSNFVVPVYDSQWMNHFRDSDGYYRFEDFTRPSCVEDLVVLSDSTDDTSDTSDDSSAESDDENSEDDKLFSFKVVLKASHMEKKSRGVVRVRGAEQWTVEALRNHRVCRFGIGWDDFIEDNNLSADDVLYFEYVGHYGFHVKIDG